MVDSRPEISFEPQPAAAARPRLPARALLRNLTAYALALAIIGYLLRDVPLKQLGRAMTQARLSWFVAASVLGFVFNLAGETFLFSRLFTYLCVPTRFAEMLPINATHFFLQVVNNVAAGTALTLMVAKHKGIARLQAGFTLLFQGFVDFFLILALIAAGDLVLRPNPRVPWFLLLAGLLSLATSAWFWLRGRHPRWRLLRWLYERPSLLAFRHARLADYWCLAALRAFMFIVQASVLYLQMCSFHLSLPFSSVLLLYPTLLLINALPLTPVGMGVHQAALIIVFGGMCAKPTLLALGLAGDTLAILMRLALGPMVLARIVGEATASL
jgi:uncharacterized membrane protein YbhN (UPF0104 family)